MGDIISRLQLAERAQRDSFVLVIGLFDLVFVITLEDLVIGITDQFQVFVDETLVDIESDGREGDLGLEVFENSIESFQLPRVFGEEEYGIFFSFPGFEVADQEVELAIEGGLRPGVELDHEGCSCCAGEGGPVGRR